jgi:hypothetical protein
MGTILFAERSTTAFWLSLALVVTALTLLSWQRVNEARAASSSKSE